MDEQLIIDIFAIFCQILVSQTFIFIVGHIILDGCQHLSELFGTHSISVLSIPIFEELFDIDPLSFNELVDIPFQPVRHFQLFLGVIDKQIGSSVFCVIYFHQINELFPQYFIIQRRLVLFNQHEEILIRQLNLAHIQAQPELLFSNHPTSQFIKVLQKLAHSNSLFADLYLQPIDQQIPITLVEIMMPCFRFVLVYQFGLALIVHQVFEL